jgi:hypothetical protein
MSKRAASLTPILLVCAACVASLTLSAQQPPRPFPQPSQPRPSGPPPPPAAPTSETAPLPGGVGIPTEATLGVPIYPNAQFLTSYDAGRGQRFYLFGVVLPFADAVTYYRSTLKSRGEVLFESPPTHQFEIARFRDDVMAFPPSVTIKDYTWGGSGGYPNPTPGAEPARFPTVIQVVPTPGGPPLQR